MQQEHAAPEAVIYCRVSTRQQEDGTSLETQEEQCRAYAHAHGYRIVAVFRDTHTGYELDRPGLSAVRVLVRTGRVQHVVMHTLDRLSRKQTHQAILLGEMEEEYGVSVEFAGEQADNTLAGRILRSALGIAAEIEREKIIERTQRNIRKRAEKGKPMGAAAPPYGYRWADAEKSGFVEDEETAPVVRRIFREAAAGVTQRAIARGLQADGIPTPSLVRAARGQWYFEKRPVGTYWDYTVVGRLLRDAAYVGHKLAYRVKVTKETVRDQRSGRLRRVRRVLPRTAEDAPPILLPAKACPALVDAETWEAVQRRLPDNKRLASRNNRDPEATLLRGHITCGHCQATVITNRVAGRWVYSCSQRPYRAANPNRACPGGGYAVTAATLDCEVWERWVQPLLGCPRCLERIAASTWSTGTEADNEQLTQLARQMQRKQAELDRLAARTADETDELVARALNKQMHETAGLLRQLEADHAALALAFEQDSWYQAEMEAFASWWAQHGASATFTPEEGKYGGSFHWSTMFGHVPYAQKREILRRLGIQVVVYRLGALPHGRRYKIFISAPFPFQRCDRHALPLSEEGTGVDDDAIVSYTPESVPRANPCPEMATITTVGAREPEA